MSKLDKLKTLIPMEEIEAGAQQQIYALLDMDFVNRMVILPDVHAGYLMPVGSAVLMDEVISPEGVGYDIGCGMSMAILNIRADTLSEKDRDDLFTELYRKIPVGFASHPEQNNEITFKSVMPDAVKAFSQSVELKMRTQLGTLGSGNHFIEIGEVRDGRLAIVIHSGSRNAGHQVCTFYKDLSLHHDTHLPSGFLSMESEFGRAYYQDMLKCEGWALENRKHMMSTVIKAITGASPCGSYVSLFVNESHNHAILGPFCRVLHRKGATPALMDQLGVIPGNMRDGTYLTRGLGNQEYLSSSSHGAGRVLSRKKAKQILDLEEFRQGMQGIRARVNKETLDEAPKAYKDLNAVIAAQDGVVIDVIDKVTPFISIKG